MGYRLPRRPYGAAEHLLVQGQLASWDDAPTTVSSAYNTPGSSTSKSDGNRPGTGSTKVWLGNGWALAGVDIAVQDVGETTSMGGEGMSPERAAQTRDSKLAVFLDEPPGSGIYFPENLERSLPEMAYLF